MRSTFCSFSFAAARTARQTPSMRGCAGGFSPRGYHVPPAVATTRTITPNQKPFTATSEGAAGGDKPRSSLHSFKSSSLAYLSALPLVAANVVESSEAVPWYQMFGHAPSPFAEFLGVAPLGMFFFLQMSPMQTMKDIQRDKSVGQLSCLPFITLGVNCVVWTAYGALQMDPTIAISNGMGAVLSGYYTSVFAKYTTEDMSKYYMGGAAFLAASAGASAVLPAIGVLPDAASVLGIMGNITAISFFASPLSVIQTVLRDKSTAAMPFIVTVATTLNCMAWSSYGLLVAHDPYVIAPNIIGLTLATVQLSLFARFGIHKMPPKPTSKV